MSRARVCSRFFLIVLSALAVLFVKGAFMPEAEAYEEELSEFGARLRLTLLPARVRLATPVPGFLDGGRGALIRAMKLWSGASCSRLDFVEATEDEEALIEVHAISEEWKYGNVIAAHTEVASEPTTGAITGVTIEIDATRKWSDEAEVPADALDLSSVLLHELGHAAGLAHSRNSAAVMRAGIKPGHAKKQALHADDIAGACAKYPLDSVNQAEKRRSPPNELSSKNSLLVMGAFDIIGALFSFVALSRRSRRNNRKRNNI